MKPILILFLLACTGDYEEPTYLVLDDPTPNLPAPTFPAYTFDDGAPPAPICVFLIYPCDPIPDYLTFVHFDCYGNFVSTKQASPTVPCRGWDMYCVPAGSTGRVEMVAWKWNAALGRYVPVASKTENLGCP